MRDIIVLCGFSCVGKDTVARQLEERGYHFVVSTTTRPMREGESEGNPYRFTDNRTFELMIQNKDFIEYRKYNTLVKGVRETWYYGVEKREVEPGKNVVVLDIDGLIAFKKYFGNRILSFFMLAPLDIRESRCKKRGGYDEKEWMRRLKDDLKRFPIEKIKKHIDVVIPFSMNDDTLKFITNIPLL